jgi:hypothetical protein
VDCHPKPQDREAMLPRSQLITLLLVAVAAAPVAAIALWSINRTVIDISDPCATWDYPSDQPVYVHVGPHDPCRAGTVHVESKTRAVLRTALVPGGLLIAAVLAILGASLSHRRVLIAGGIGMLAETVVVFSIAPVTLIVGVSFLLLAKRVPAGA